MEKTNLLTLVVTLTVGIILAGSLLMPILDDTTTTQKTLTNSGYFRMSDVSDATEDYVITWDYTEPTKLGINDETFTFDDASLPALSSRSIVFSDSFLARLYNNGGGTYSLQIWITSYDTGVSTTALTSATITISSESMIWVTSSDTTKTYSYTGYIYAIDPNGDMIMKSATDSAYVLSDSPIVGAGVSFVGGSANYVFHVDGTYDNMDVTCGSNTITIDDIETHYTQDSTYVDVYKFNSITFQTTYSGDGSIKDQTYNYVAVPYQVTAELSQHLNAGEIALLNALPILVIIGLVMAGVGAIFIRNRD